MKKRIIILICLLLPFLVSSVPQIASGYDAGDRIVVVLDPGHGGRDPGAVYSGVAERERALLLAQYCKEYLEGTGKFTVYLTRTDNDTALDLCDRAVIADRYDPDILISLHFNSIAEQYQYMRGATVLGSVKDKYFDEKLANLFRDKLNEYVGLKKLKITRRTDEGTTLYYWNSDLNWDLPNDTSFGQLTDYYGMLGWCSRYGFPAYIIEHAYISNPDDRALIANDATLQQMAKADADALIEYYTGHEHVFSSEMTADIPTSCINGGKQSYKCEICGCRKNVTPISAAPDKDKHLYYLGASVAPTCTEPGSKTYYCGYTRRYYDVNHAEYGNHSYTVTVPATGHSFAVVQTVPTTPDAIGYTLYRCSSCGLEYRESDPNGCVHSYVETERKAPTCTENGSVTKKCTNCGDTVVETLPAAGHEMRQEISPAGVTYEVCSVCGYTDYDLASETLPQPIDSETSSVPSDSETDPSAAESETSPESAGPADTDPTVPQEGDAKKAVVVIVLAAVILLCVIFLAFLLLKRKDRKA